jgi:subfamily B ATP-binding cassette protein MsbA
MAETIVQPKPGSEWDTYFRLLRYSRPYAGRLVVGILFGLLFGGSTTGLLVGLKKTLASVFNPGEFSMVATVTVAALLPLFGLIRGLGDFFSTYLIEWVGNRVVMDLRQAMFTHYQALSLGFFGQARTGDVISRTTNDTQLVERAVAVVLSDLAKQPFTLIGLIGFLIWTNWHLAVVSLVVFPICILPVALFGRKVRRSSREGQQKMADLVSILEENILGVRIVKAFGMEPYEIARFSERCRGVFSRAMKVTRARASVEPIIVLISLLGFALILVYARWSHMTFDEFFSFGAALVAMYDPVKRLSKVHLNIQQSSAAADRIFEMLDEPIVVKEKPGALVFQEPLQAVRFEKVSFSYGEGQVLRDISFAAGRGQVVALVGSSGSGKTTLVSLVPRFYDVTGGCIRINEHDVRDLTLASLRRQLGMVTQETVLFNDTVARNVSYGEETVTREAVVDAARRANAHEFIEALPEGYDTVIGERGMRLSGGQRQRLAIARALLRNPPILILDEATSALDTESERLVQGALETLMAGRTVLAIAHRLSTVQHADCILVLDQGRIAESGTHTELLARGGLYRRLYEMQFQEPSSTTDGHG